MMPMCLVGALKLYTFFYVVMQLQAFLLVADDIMDQSHTRRGKPCWYLVESTAINDAFLLESIMYRIISLHFKPKPTFGIILECFMETTYFSLISFIDTRRKWDN